MANMFGVMSGAFHNGGGGNGSSEQEDAYYRAQLTEWLRKQKYQEELDARAYAEQQARQLQEQLPGALDQAMQNSGYQQSPASNASFEVLKKVAGIGSPLMAGPIQQMLTKSQAGLVSAGTPTQKMKEYDQAQQDPQFQQWLNEQRQVNTPAALQIAQSLAQARGLQVPGEEEIVQAGKLSTPDSIAANEAAKTAAAQDTKFAVEKINAANKALSQYDDVVGQSNTMLANIAGMREAMAKNPNVAGFGSYLRFLPETDAKAFANSRQALVSGLAMENLQHLKSISPTGASGFGALSESELRVLQDSIVRLDVETDPATVNKMLGIIEEKLNKVKQAAVRDFQRDASWVENAKGIAPLTWQPPVAPVNDFTNDFLNKRKQLAPAAPANGGWRVLR
jgi:hypothetical protein